MNFKFLSSDSSLHPALWLHTFLCAFHLHPYDLISSLEGLPSSTAKQLNHPSRSGLNTTCLWALSLSIPLHKCLFCSYSSTLWPSIRRFLQIIIRDASGSPSSSISAFLLWSLHKNHPWCLSEMKTGESYSDWVNYNLWRWGTSCTHWSFRIIVSRLAGILIY